ncbi:MAG: tRNA 2-selenouridine(34) synthase MnmH [Deltaproteobacteria bacterium]|nr:tRNA 2-selenouridine(34) synthase MnmH [Deltaproteobacteria bacterium]
MDSLKEKLIATIKVPKISPQDWLKNRRSWPLLDVRSEGEFLEGHLPDSITAPILNNEERHQVGLTYKQKGQEAAIALGLALVAPHKQKRIEHWLKHLESSVAVTCWRGGLRSRFASGWLEETVGNKLNIVQIAGGYKAIRRQLLIEIAAQRPMLILGGMTGSGKTRLLQELSVDKDFPGRQIIDLESMAKHRGSSFGGLLADLGKVVEQPRQQTFENSLGLGLFDAKGPVVLENESSLIGRVFIPQNFRVQMKQAPLIILEAPMHERISFIFKEYIEEPIKAQCPIPRLWEILGQNLKALEKRLGGKETARALKLLEEGGTSPLDLERQSPWIELLLVQYYDKAYSYALTRSQQKVTFKGNALEMKEWLNKTLVERKNHV